MKILTWKMIQGVDKVINKCIDSLVAGEVSFEVGDTVGDCLWFHYDNLIGEVKDE